MIGDRLKLAREAAGMSLRDLEAAMHGLVSAQAIGKYERDEMMPGSNVMLAISKALQVSPEYLLSRNKIELTGIDFRKDPHTSAKDERRVEATILDKVEKYLELEELLPDGGLLWQAPSSPAFHINNIEAAEMAADQLREVWSLGLDPIPSMTELLEEKGVKVIALNLPIEVSGSKAFVKRADHQEVPVIVVNDQHNGERQRFTLAHELAHLILDFIDMNDKDQEKAADRFAGAFLMAKEMVLNVLGKHRTLISFGELAELKKIFKVSIAALAVRCAQLGILPKSVYYKLWHQIKALGWNSPNSNEPNQFAAEVPERMKRLCLKAVSEGAMTLSKAASLLNMTPRDFDKVMLEGSL
ncbi:MAG: helix-turn-helix domain-containing protein [Candidatus Paceibacterota bacterium]